MLLQTRGLSLASALVLARASAFRVGSVVSSKTAVLRGGAKMSTAAASAHTNPLLQQEGLPRFSQLDSTHVKPALTEALAALEKNFASLEGDLEHGQPAAMYSQVVESLEKIEAPVEYAWGVVGHLMGVQNSDALRTAHAEMQGDVIKATAKLSQSSTVFKAIQAVAAGDEELAPAQRRVLENSLTSMRLSGVGLEGEAKEAFNAHRVALAELSTKFSNNVLDATKAYSLLVTERAQVEGLPDSTLALLASRAEEAGEAGATAAAGPWKLGLDMPSYLPAMKFVRDRAVREKLYRAFVSRAAQENEPLVREILSRKKTQARLLGFGSHAEVSLQRKMADSVEAVSALTELLRERAYPAAQAELAELTAFAAAAGGPEKLELWDVPFWSERQAESRFGFTEEELRPYFALPNVLGGLFGLCERLYGVQIVPADGEAEVWNEDVLFFKVVDTTSSEHIASFFLDPYARPADKRGGAWMDVCVGKSRVLNRKPVAYLTCNGSPPVGGKPSLMTFAEVTTLFHETGHGLQHMLTTVRRDRESHMISARLTSDGGHFSRRFPRPRPLESPASSGTRSSCLRSSWRIGATMPPPSTAPAWRSITRRASRCLESSSTSCVSKRHTRRGSL
jgi:oligopeptidase A